MTRDLAPRELPISQGIAAAGRHGGAADHVTARRMPLLLRSWSQDPNLMRGFIRLAGTGVSRQEFKGRLRHAEPAGREAAG